jgi:hypothetical protein
VCGLTVEPHPNPECRDRWVVVHPGIAIDCYGRELVLREKTAFQFTEELVEDLRANAAGQTTNQTEDQQGYLLILRYCEERIEFVPALYDEGTCDPSRREANRVREVAQLEWRRRIEVPDQCWKGTKATGCIDDCDDERLGPGGTCLDPICLCGDLVPLALIVPAAPSAPPTHQHTEVHQPTASPTRRLPFDIDRSGRTELPPPRSLLTQIKAISWAHGGELSIRDLKSGDDYRLEVTFSRKIKPVPDDERAIGINRNTFIIQYQGAQQNLEFLPYEQPPKLDPNDPCKAIFTIKRSMLDPNEEGPTISSRTIFYITLKCDFIMDCHDLPVDGNFLRGELPTGDGIVGGTFESWFRVKR